MLSIAANGCLCWGAEGRFCLCAGLRQPRQPGLGGCSLQTFIQRLFWGVFFGTAERTLVFAFQTVLGYLSVRCSKKKKGLLSHWLLSRLVDWLMQNDFLLLMFFSARSHPQQAERMQWFFLILVCFFGGGNEGQVFLESRTHHRKNHPLVCIWANPDLL